MRDSTLMRLAMAGSAFSLLWLWMVSQNAAFPFFPVQDIRENDYLVLSGSVNAVSDTGKTLRFAVQTQKGASEVIIFKGDNVLRHGLNLTENMQVMVKGRAHLENGKLLVLADSLVSLPPGHESDGESAYQQQHDQAKNLGMEKGCPE